MKYLLGLPVADAKKLKDFLKNIDDLDLTNKPVVGVPNLFEIKGLIEAGAFLRYDPALAYGLVGEWREEVFAYKALPDANLLGSNDLVVLIDSTKEQSAERKKAFDRLRKEGSTPSNAEPMNRRRPSMCARRRRRISSTRSNATSWSRSGSASGGRPTCPRTAFRSTLTCRHSKERRWRTASR